MKIRIAILVITTTFLLVLIAIVIGSALAQEPLSFTFWPMIVGDGSGVLLPTSTPSAPHLPTSTPLSKVTLCHKPLTINKTLSVAPPAVQGHWDHGDSPGACLPWTPTLTSTPIPTSTPSRPKNS
jgi:hypothetical protein